MLTTIQLVTLVAIVAISVVLLSGGVAAFVSHEKSQTINALRSERDFLREQLRRKSWPDRDWENVTPLPSEAIPILNGLKTGFNMDELVELCQNLGIDSDSLNKRTRDALASDITMWAVRHGEVERLITHCGNLRPNIQWHTPKL